MARFQSVLAAILIAGLTACAQQGSELQAIRQTVSALQQSNSELKRDLDALKNQQDELRESVSDIVYREALGRWSTATFDPVTNQGFRRVDTSLVTLSVSVKDIQPYADGVKVTLEVGNLSSATLSDVTGTASYGRSAHRDDTLSTVEFLRSLNSPDREKPHRKNFSVPNDLPAGAWTNVPLTLPGIKPSDFGSLSVSLDAGTISLHHSR